MNKNIALVTYQDKGAYHNSTVANEDDVLVGFLNAKGLTVKKEIWNDDRVNWKNYDLIILKSPWDYFNLIDDFYTWLSSMEKFSIKVLNPIDTVRWNSDKHHLQDIERAGLKVTPSVFLEKGQSVDLTVYFHQFKTEAFIVKPAVSGGSKNTFKITSANAKDYNAQLSALLQVEDFIVQPFLEEIEEVGEWSFVFFGGKFSHSLIKKAKNGDFRVQSAFGGSVHPLLPEPRLLEAAQQSVDRFATNCLYARVDGAVLNGELILMELELIEPFLFLDTNPKALDNYYQALLMHLNMD